MPTSHPSVQLYTVRDAYVADPEGTLGRLAAAGLRHVEPFAVLEHAETLGPALAASGLTAPTAHQSFLDLDAREMLRVLDCARDLGITTVIDPYVAEGRWRDRASVDAIAERMAVQLRYARERGIRLGYHNHAHEITARVAGTAALEYFAAQLPEDVVLEVDAYWVTVGGDDPVAVIERLGSRVAALHLKDATGFADLLDQVAVGSGVLPVLDVIAAAPDALRVIEMDDSRLDRFEAIADSVRYLSAVGAGA